MFQSSPALSDGRYTMGKAQQRQTSLFQSSPALSDGRYSPFKKERAYSMLPRQIREPDEALPEQGIVHSLTSLNLLKLFIRESPLLFISTPRSRYTINGSSSKNMVRISP